MKRGRKQGEIADAAAEKVWRELDDLGWAVALRDRARFRAVGVQPSGVFWAEVFWRAIHEERLKPEHQPWDDGAATFLSLKVW